MPPLIWRRIERLCRQFDAIPVFTCACIRNCPDQDLGVLLGDGNKLGGRGSNGSLIPYAFAERSGRSECIFYPPQSLLTSCHRNNESNAKIHHEFSSSVLEPTGSMVYGCMRISGNLQVYLRCLHGKSGRRSSAFPAVLLT